MKKTQPLFYLIIILMISACTSTPVLAPAPVEETQVPTTESPTATVHAPTAKTYTTDAFGLSFQYPSGWFGPDEYVGNVDEKGRLHRHVLMAPDEYIGVVDPFPSFAHCAGAMLLLVLPALEAQNEDNSTPDEK